MKFYSFLIPFFAVSLLSNVTDSNVDNTRINRRDRNPNTLTPDQQSENQSDLDVTQKIRKLLMDDATLGINAKNIKIITLDGTVTLRGVVDSSQEKSLIESKVKSVAGIKKIDNQLDVKNTK